MDINSFRFGDCEVDNDISMPKLFKVQRDALDIDQFVMYVLSEYNNIREGDYHSAILINFDKFLRLVKKLQSIHCLF